MRVSFAPRPPVRRAEPACPRCGHPGPRHADDCLHRDEPAGRQHVAVLEPSGTAGDRSGLALPDDGLWEWPDRFVTEAPPADAAAAALSA